MRATKGRDNNFEREVRRALHAMGLRFRIYKKLIENSRRTVDLTFPSARIAVFIDGCFWHGCPTHRTYPKTNASWWASKIESNIARDRDTDERLRRLGWKVIRVWGHEPAGSAARRIATAVIRAKGSK